MKSKMFKRVLTLSLAGAMVVSTAACGSSTSGDSSEVTSVTWSVVDNNAGNNNVGDYAEEIMQDVEDYVGYDLELTWVAADALTEKNSLYMATPASMPMIMSWSGTVTGDVVSAAKNGAFVDLNDYIWDEEKYPNLSQMSTSVAANLEVDGALIAVPKSRVLGRSGLSYRTDWAEKLDVVLPENATYDDVYELMYAFTYGDPDGNGVDDTYGLEMIGDYMGTFDIIPPGFGCGNGWAEVDGPLGPVW
ncbi:MAG: ABC transporter substrate-binding protein, partial [Lachnospiraceae bacterium]|nr:ABC transporter substrate-binding protein [Lachnospiraceae bacterium]